MWKQIRIGRFVSLLFILPLLTGPVFLFLSSPQCGPFDWDYAHLKALDGSDDSHNFGDGKNGARDILAFYYKEATSTLDFRVDLFNLSSGDESQYLNLYVAMDFLPGSEWWLPDNVECGSNLGWDYCISVYDGSTYTVYDTAFASYPGWVSSVSFNAELDFVEFSIYSDSLDGFSPGTTINFQVYTTKDGTNGGAGEIADHSDVCDAIVDDDHGWSDGDLDGSFDSNDNTGRAKVAFVQHGNQHIAYTDVFRGESGNEDASGFDENLEAHDTYDVPVNLHISGTLMSGAAWNDQAFNTWVASGVTNNRYEMLTSAYAQHIMPYFYDSLNIKSINVHKELCNYFYGYDPNVAWIPERVWKDTVWGERFEDVFQATYVDAVILDDDTHHDWFCDPPCGNPMKLHQLQNGLRVIFRNGWVSGEVLATPSPTDDLKRHWLSLALDGDQEKLSVYAMDWEITASVAGWGQQFPDAPIRYESNIRYIAAHPWIQACTLTDLLSWGWTTTPIEIGDATYSALEAWTGNTHYDSWYNEWDNWTPFGCTKNSTQLWQEAYSAVHNAAANNLRDVAWITLLANLYECGWQDVGSGMSGWMKDITSHLRHANVYAYAADWVAEPVKNDTAFWHDVDNDGTDEVVLRNDKLMAIFEPVGGRAQWIFDYTGHVVVGNSMVRWSGTEGDYNDNDHIGALSDVSPTYRDFLYSMTIYNTPTGDTVQVTLQYDHITKVVRLSTGDQYLQVTYTNTHETTWLQTGFSPGVMDLLRTGQSSADRIWETGYVGYRNNSTGTVGAYIWDDGVSFQKSETKTIAWMDEIYGGPGNFSFRLHAGPVPLSLLSVDYVDTLTVDVLFAKKLDASTSEEESNYSIDNGIGNPSTALLQPDSFTVRLSSALRFTLGTTYKLTVTGVQDSEGIPITEDDSANVGYFGVAPITFCVADTSDSAYAPGYRLKGSWDTSEPHRYDPLWGLGHLYDMYDDGTHGDDTPNDHIWKRTLNLVSDLGLNSWEWGVTDTGGIWIDGNWGFTVSDASPDTLLFTPLAGISQDVRVVFTVNCEAFSGSIQSGVWLVGSRLPLQWGASTPDLSNPMDPLGNSVYSRSVVFPAGTEPDVEFKFVIDADIAGWSEAELQGQPNRDFLIDDSDTVQVLDTLYYDNQQMEYDCGDCNGDDRITIADATYLVGFIYRSGAAPYGQADVNLDGRTTIADATYLVGFIYRGGAPPCDPPLRGKR